MTAKNKSRDRKAWLARLLTAKRRKTAAEKMDAAERDQRLEDWSAAMDTLQAVGQRIQLVTKAQSDASDSGAPLFTPMRADFEWAKRVTKQLKQLADEIERYT